MSGTQTPTPAHPALARPVMLSATGSAGQCRGVWASQGCPGQCREMLAAMEWAGTFWSGVGSPQCTVRVMSVVPSLQRGGHKGLMQLQRWLWGALDVGLWWGGSCSKLRTDIALRCQRGTSLSQTASGCSRWRGCEGRGIRSLSQLPIAHHALPTAHHCPSHTCSEPALR